jgi:hypothetical protein
MNLEGRKIIVNKSSKDLVEILKSPENYKDFMPDGLQNLKPEKMDLNSGCKGCRKLL